MKKYILILLLILLLHAFLLVNLQFTAWPEMISYAYLKNGEFGLYADMIHPYPPLLTTLLAYLYLIFGYGVEVLQVATWTLILGVDVLIYLIVRKISLSSVWALLSVFMYVLLQPFLEGNMLWFDLAIVAPILLGLYFLLHDWKGRFFAKYLFLAGVSFGLAALIKQTAGLFLLIAGFYLLIKTKSIKNIVYLFLGPVIMVAVLLMWQLMAGTFEHFINWTLIYPMTAWSKFPGYVQMELTGYQLITIGVLLLPILVVLVNELRILLLDDVFQLLGLFLLGSFVAIYPRFSFFHFQLALALIIVIGGYLISKYKYAKWLYISYLFLIPVVHKPIIYRQWRVETRFYDTGDAELSRHINEQVVGGESVYLLGLHSGLYSMMDNLPSKPWIDNFGWYLEVEGVQEWVIEGWESDPPGKIVWNEPSVGNWYDLGVYQPKEITNWITDNYNRGEEIGSGITIWERKN